MPQKLIIAALFAATTIFSSCAAKKKLQTANAEIKSLTAANSKLTSSNDDLQKQITALNDGIKSAKEEFAVYKTECETNAEKLAVVRSALEELQNNVEEVENKLDAAMADFKDKGVEVYAKDGLVYVNMQEKLLYKSGSSVLNADGKQALSALADALNGYPKLKVYVVGNTDDRKFKTSSTDNLSLSTERANGVVRVLRDDYKVDPARLTAAGKGKYAPVADNATEEGRARNRRTEIVLHPDLVKLWESVQPN